jgi:site-specific DNA-methyltransferase (adenine-specific)
MTRAETIAEGVTLYLGDCREILPLVGKVDAVLADPPYGIPHAFGEQKGHGRKGTRALQFAWDGPGATAAVLEACALAASLADAQLWFCGLHQASFIADTLLKAGMVSKAGAWVKECPPPAGAGNWWPSGFELAVYAYRAGAWFGDTDPKRSNVWLADSYRFGQPGKVDHPTQKPLDLIKRLVTAIVAPRGVALDPFMGSGTTGVAAVATGRRFIGIELEEKYFDIACGRIDEAARTPDLFIEKPKPPSQVTFAEIWKEPFYKDAAE